MRRHWSTRWLTFGSTGLQLGDSQSEVVAQSEGDTRGDAHSLVDNLPDTLAEVEEETLGDTLSDAQALVKALADTVAEVAE